MQLQVRLLVRSDPALGARELRLLAAVVALVFPERPLARVRSLALLAIEHQLPLAT